MPFYPGRHFHTAGVTCSPRCPGSSPLVYTQTSLRSYEPAGEPSTGADDTDHGPEVVGHLLSVLKDGPEEEVPPRMFAALLGLRHVLLGVEQSALRRLLLQRTHFIKPAAGTQLQGGEQSSLGSHDLLIRGRYCKINNLRCLEKSSVSKRWVGSVNRRC